MIGVFDSGIGGLTILRSLAERFPGQSFRYLGDHANMPYGDRGADEIVALTQAGTEWLFEAGCQLVILGCNTATAIATRRLQREWLPSSRWHGRNVLGIVAPTVEAATQTPWAVTTPQYPQKYNTDLVAVFGTRRTIASGVYVEEISKRCPKVRVIQQACPGLADAIEQQAPTDVVDRLVASAVTDVLAKAEHPPHRAILGCTHYPLVADVFARHLPAFTRLLSQPDAVADSLEDYLGRHPRFAIETGPATVRLATTGNPAMADRAAQVFWLGAPSFETDRIPASAH